MLRTRLTLGLVCLLVILLSMGLYSINQCSELGKRIEAITRDNDESGQSLRQMKRSGALMTGALLSLVTEDQADSGNDFAKASHSFKEALDEENARETATPEEKKQIAKLTDAYQAYEARARAFLQSSDRSDAAWKTMAHKLGQDTGDLLDMVDQLALAHEEGLKLGGRDTHADLIGTIRSLILLMITAAIVAIYASMRLSRGLLQPLISVTSSIRRVGEGNLDQTVPVGSKD